MRSLSAACRVIVLIVALAFWIARAGRLVLRLLARARDPNAGPPHDLAEVLTDVGMDGLAEVLADVPSVEVDPAMEAVARASTWGRHAG